MKKFEAAVSRAIRWVIKERLPEVIIFMIVTPVMYASLTLYYIKYITKYATENPSYNFEIAILSTTLGGFVLIGGFLEKTNTSLRKQLINVGKWFLTSAVFSSIFGFAIPLHAIMDKQDNIAAYYLLDSVVAISMILAIVGFVWGIALLVTLLWKIGKYQSQKN